MQFKAVLLSLICFLDIGLDM